MKNVFIANRVEDNAIFISHKFGLFRHDFCYERTLIAIGDEKELVAIS